jgi:hypothetical protein
MTARMTVDLEAELARSRTAVLVERFDEFTPRSLTWLAALPAWTCVLGDRLGLGGSMSTAKLVSRLKAADLIETRDVLEPDGILGESFWMRAAVRPELGRYLLGERGKSVGRDLPLVWTFVRSACATGTPWSSATASMRPASTWLATSTDSWTMAGSPKRPAWSPRRGTWAN